MREYVFNGLVMSLVWMMVRGSASGTTAVFGAAVGVFTAYRFRGVFGNRSIHFSSLRRIPYALSYFRAFIIDLLKSNLEVAYIVLGGKETDPGGFSYSHSLEDRTALAVLANTITLTPGTLTVRCTEEKLEVHCIRLEDRQEARDEIENMEEKLKKVFNDDN